MHAFLDFEQPIAELEAKINELRHVGSDSAVNISEEIARLERKCVDLTKRIFSDLSPWQVVQIARHPSRPHTRDYINGIFTEFDELSGDRHYSAAPSIIGGVALLDDKPVMVIGHQKGRKTKEKIQRNFGMARPEAYRKALRLAKLAEKFKLPIFTFIDTQGAYPGIGAEERNQSEAIARNLLEFSRLETPVICTVIGEGGSGGALAIGVGDRLLMMEYSIYSVISPEGCASILWKSAEKAKDAATALNLTAKRLHELKIVDQVITEPLGGAHRDYEETFAKLKTALNDELAHCQRTPLPDLLHKRYDKLMQHGMP